MVNETPAKELVNKLVHMVGGRDIDDFRGYKYPVISVGIQFCILCREIDRNFVGSKELRKASSSLALVEEVANDDESVD